MYICTFIFLLDIWNMKKEATVSLIIATYNWTEALELCLNSILKQTVLPSEVIIADDGSDKRTAELIWDFAKKVPFPIFHEWHEDNGFRKTIVLNRAIRKASCAYIVQIDGDIIVSSHFIEDHLYMSEEGCFIRGTRANLDAKTTVVLFKKGKLSMSNKLLLITKQPTNALRLYPAIAQFATRKELSGRRVKGCNMSFWKKDLISVNGYDNNLRGWGHEDEELSWRLVNLGIQKKIIKFTAIVYHIYHKQLSRKDEPLHREFMQTIKDEKLARTNNGLEEI